MDYKKNNYALQEETARADFLKWNQRDLIERFDLEFDNDFMYIDFFNERHRV